MSNFHANQFHQKCGALSMVPGRPSDTQNLEAIKQGTGLYKKCWDCVKKCDPKKDECDISACFNPHVTPEKLEAAMKEYAKQQ